jgi:lipoprotein signal peptidase
VLAALILGTKDKMIVLGLSCIMLGALFNVFDRAIPTSFAVNVDEYQAGDKINFVVVDYLQFGSFLG